MRHQVDLTPRRAASTRRPDVSTPPQAAFDATPGRFQATPGRFDATPGRFEATPGRFDATPGRFESTPGRFEATPGRFEGDAVALRRDARPRRRRREPLGGDAGARRRAPGPAEAALGRDAAPTGGARDEAEAAGTRPLLLVILPRLLLDWVEQRLLDW